MRTSCKGAAARLVMQCAVHQARRTACSITTRSCLMLLVPYCSRAYARMFTMPCSSLVHHASFTMARSPCPSAVYVCTRPCTCTCHTCLLAVLPDSPELPPPLHPLVYVSVYLCMPMQSYSTATTVSGLSALNSHLSSGPTASDIRTMMESRNPYQTMHPCPDTTITGHAMTQDVLRHLSLWPTGRSTLLEPALGGNGRGTLEQTVAILTKGVKANVGAWNGVLEADRRMGQGEGGMTRPAEGVQVGFPAYTHAHTRSHTDRHTNMSAEERPRAHRQHVGSMH